MYGWVGFWDGLGARVLILGGGWGDKHDYDFRPGNSVGRGFRLGSLQLVTVFCDIRSIRR